MNSEFHMAFIRVGTDWLSWIGMPMLYDGGLCVNREQEEVKYSKLRRGDLIV